MSENRLFLSGEENKYSSAVARGPLDRFNSKIPPAQFFSTLLITVKGGNSGTLSYFSNFAYNSGFMQLRYAALASSIIMGARSA